MKRILICFFSLCIIALAACGEDDDNGNNGDNSGGVSAETHAFVADYLHDSITFINVINEVNCECSYESMEMNFDDAEECREELLVSSETEEGAIECLRDAINEEGMEPTQGHFDYFNCQLSVFEEYGECFDLSDEDLCLDASMIVRGACMENFDDDLNACEETFENDEEAQQWEENLDGQGEDCLDFL